MRIVIVGLGLIGGSMAKALSFSGNHEIFAMDRDDQVLLDAHSMDVIAGNAGVQQLEAADVVYLCLYPQAVVQFTEEWGHCIGKHTIVTDVCGIKNGVYTELKALSRKFGFTYIGSHPMAGKEQSSFYASDSGLFRGASYIITEEDASAPGVGTLQALAKEMGFGTLVTVSPEEHDEIIAFTSQLPHALACAYVMSPRCEKHKGFSAGSYRDVSRVANINEELWTGLFLSNKEKLWEELETLQGNLSEIQAALKAGDRERLRALLRQAREIKEKD